TYPKPHVIFLLLFGQFRGLLLLSPVLILTPLGWWLWHRTRTDLGALVVAILIPLYYLWLNGSYFYWDGGWSFGPRHMTGALPFVAFALAPVWASASRYARGALAALCGVAIVL